MKYRLTTIVEANNIEEALEIAIQEASFIIEEVEDENL